MEDIKIMARNLYTCLEQDMKIYEEDYRDTSEDTQSLPALKIRKRELEGIWMNIHTKYNNLRESPQFLDREASKGVDMPEITKLVRSARQFYRASMTSIEEAIEMQTNAKSRASLPHPTEQNATSSSGIHVSPCEIPVFSGDFKTWSSFRDIFTAVYGENPRLSGIERLCKLKEKTRGEAREIVDSAPVANDGFDIAWAELLAQYEDRRRQVNAQLKILFTLPIVNSPCGFQIRKLQRTINNCIAVLNSLQIDTANWDPIIIYICTSKIPKETLLIFERSLDDNTTIPSWAELDAFLTSEYKGLEAATDAKALQVNVVQNPTQNQPQNLNPKHRQNNNVKNYYEKRGNVFLNVTQQPSKDNRFRKPPPQEHLNPQRQQINPRREQNSLPSDFSKPKANRPDGSTCALCRENHTLRDCSSFNSMTVNERSEFVKKNGFCYNCLAVGHALKVCRSAFTCKHCGSRHNSLLHKPRSNTEPQNTQSDLSQQSTSRNAAQTFSISTHTKSLDDRKRLVGTAMVNVEFQGSLIPVRALIDPASDYTFVSDSLRKKLKLPTTPIRAEISGVNESHSGSPDKMCDIILRSDKCSEFRILLQAIVLRVIANNIPTRSLNPEILKECQNIPLADERFFESRPVDVLIGGDYYPQIMRKTASRDCMTLLAQESHFGWILTGPLDDLQKPQPVVSHFSTITLDKCLTKFWEMEEVVKKPIKSVEDTLCEEYFVKTTVRLPNGRYQVNLPFRTPQIELGNSRHIAMAQYLRNEKNLLKKPELKEEYDNVLQEYIDLGHMKPVDHNPTTSSEAHYYLPHHAVVKMDRITTKVRVVFNASSKTSNTLSLNDALHTGPTLQQDLVVVILKWRFYKIVFNADITKMYRQILLNSTHTPFQRILFRKSVNEPIRDYELQTVTFGVNCAPYLAIRTLLELANEVQDTHPIVSKILKDNMYVDDVLAGAHTIEDAQTAQQQLIEVLESAGFPLRKWISNTADLLDTLPKDHLLDVDLLTLPESNNAKTLGIRWNAKEDVFFFNVPKIEKKVAYTKRSVLSDIARLFDPAGWLAPIVISAKIIMQQVWQDNTAWDECLKPLTLLKWQKFLQYYDNIDKIRIPRWIQFTPSAKIEFHGFSDASEKAYSAVVYARVTPIDGPNSVTLLSAKTRVAPIKVQSLPKLELCGAVLLANMVHNLLAQLNLPQHQTYFWTDSAIVLAWLKKQPNHWNTFVANRVATISEMVGVDNWNHVVSHDNPADVASRGCSPDELREDSLWWNGPAWLKDSAAKWPTTTHNFVTQAEAKPIQTFANSVNLNPKDTESSDILNRFSKWSKSLRVMSYVYRFLDRISATRMKRNSHNVVTPDRRNLTSADDRIRILLTHPSIQIESQDINATKDRLIILCQTQYFKEEYNCLKRKTPLPKKSRLLTLTPYLDSKNIMRANGRLASSNSLSFNERHPILLPYASCFAKLLTLHVHLITLHGGNRVMLRIIRSGYWIPKLQNLISFVIAKCSPCTRYKNHQATQLMAALPPERTQLTRPFYNIGIDFAGPFDIKIYSGRTCKITKGYVCVFVCFATKAIHVEPTSDLSTQAFMAAFARFFSRRGCPAAIYSDNGTNFVGASNLLKRERQEFLRGLRDSVTAANSFQNVTWHFIPPGAPHMGGLWEAGVKRFKSHLKKLNNLKYTFEEISTLLARIEGCLNSRPLSPSSENPEDLNPLTPGHFLIGSPLLTPAEPDLKDSNPTLANRWQKLKIQHHYFCRRWKDEYLKELHKRYKWKYPQRELEVNDIVVIRQDNVAPNEWSLGRVIEVHPGPDGHTRTVDLRIPTGITTRPITKLVVLPTN